MSTDQEMIHNLLRNITPTTNNEFATCQWINQIFDLNMNNYNNGTVKFDSINQRDMWINWRDAFITLPIVVYGQTPFTAATNAPPNVALKNGVVQLIYSVQLTINNEKINNTDNLNRYHAIKQMVDNSFDYQLSTGSMYHLAKDTVNSSDSSEFTADVTALGSGLYPVVGKNAAYNDGFYKRIQLINGTYVKDAGQGGYWTFRLIVPLSLISSFFKVLDTPLFNCRIILNIGITDLIGNSNSTAFMADTAAVAAGTRIKMMIGGSIQGYNIVGVAPSCQLYLPEVTFSAKTQGMLSEMINAGFTKTVTFYDTKTILNTRTTSNANGMQDVSMILTPGIIAPMKLWLTATPHNSENSHASPSPCQATGTFTNVNILIDSKRHYNNDLVYDFEFFELLRKEYVNGGDAQDTQSGSLINYTDFTGAKGNHRYYVFDISRNIRSQLSINPAKTFSLALQATVKEAAAFDIYTHIEYEVVVTINMSTGVVKTYGSN